MTESPFYTLLKTKQHLIADGATGTNLIERGLPSGVTAENWVLDKPEMILQLHKDFINAGADIILTSTFNGSPIRLQNTPLAGRVDEVNRKAVELARKAVEGTSTLVAGSIGPLGQLLKPLGPLTPGEAEKAYAEQARMLSSAGVDLLVIETQYDLGEIKIAIQGVKSVTDLPLVASLSYDRGKRTMMGVKPSQAAKELEGLPIDMIGINCGRSLEENLENLIELRQATSKPIWFKPNAGLPRIDSMGKTIYDTTPKMMGDLAPSWILEGAKIVGGCCGTTPQHLREIAQQLKPA